MFHNLLKTGDTTLKTRWRIFQCCRSCQKAPGSLCMIEEDFSVARQHECTLSPCWAASWLELRCLSGAAEEPRGPEMWAASFCSLNFSVNTHLFLLAHPVCEQFCIKSSFLFQSAWLRLDATALLRRHFWRVNVKSTIINSSSSASASNNAEVRDVTAALPTSMSGQLHAHRGQLCSLQLLQNGAINQKSWCVFQCPEWTCSRGSCKFFLLRF